MYTERRNTYTQHKGGHVLPLAPFFCNAASIQIFSCCLRLISKAQALYLVFEPAPPLNIHKFPPQWLNIHRTFQTSVLTCSAPLAADTEKTNHPSEETVQLICSLSSSPMRLFDQDDKCLPLQSA